MDFIVSSSLLSKHMQNALPYRMNSRNLNPTLYDFLFRVEGNQLEIMATNLEVTLLTRLPVESVQQEGAVILPPDNLLDSLKKMGDIPLHITVDEKYQVRVEHSEGNQQGALSFPGTPPENFASFPQLDKEKSRSYQLEADDMTDGIEQVIFSAAKESREMIYYGVLLETTKEHIRWVAANSMRMACFTRLDMACEDEPTVFLPLQPAQLLVRTFEGKDPVQITIDDRFFYCKNDTMQYVCQLTSVEFPKYQQIIPTEEVLPHSFTVDTELLRRSLDLVIPFASRQRDMISFSLHGQELTLRAYNLESNEEAYQKLPFAYDGEDMELLYTASHVSETLQRVKSPEVVFRFSPNSEERRTLIHPAVNRSDDEEFFVLIVRLLPSDFGN